MVIYNDFIPFKGYVAITIFPFIFARKKPLSVFDLNHERIHLCQQLEVLIVALVIALVLILALGASFWWLFASLPVYYILYGVEYCVRYVLYGSQKEAYRNISFEQEAYLHEGDTRYLNNRKPFAWLEYLTKKTYEKVV